MPRWSAWIAARPSPFRHSMMRRSGKASRPRAARCPAGFPTRSPPHAIAPSRSCAAKESAMMNNWDADSLSRRRLLETAAIGIAAAGATSLLPSRFALADTGDAIRPFSVHFPQETLDDLKRRIAATRWPEAETVQDDSQGVRL